MTAQQRFERDLPGVLESLYPAVVPDYRDDIVQRTRATRQRPAWTFLERWLPMDLVMARVAPPRVPPRALAVAGLLLLLVFAGLVMYGGSRSRLPEPVGLASNGVIAYGDGGDILVRRSLAESPSVLIGGDTDDHDPYFSPDGARFLFVRSFGNREMLMTADSDGANVRPVVDQPLVGAGVWWSPDSRSVALINDVKGVPTLSIVDVIDGSVDPIDMDGVHPRDVQWRPPDGRELLVRGVKANGLVDLFLVARDGGPATPLGIRGTMHYGIEWETSGPAWSPDGTRIAYNEVRPSGTNLRGMFHLNLVAPDGTALHEVPKPNKDVNQGWPLWSPDGRWLLVHRWTWGAEGRGWISVLPGDGSDAGRDVGPYVLGGEKSGLIKAWSPDGTRILVRADNTQELFSVDPSTGASETLPWTSALLPYWQRRAP